MKNWLLLIALFFSTFLLPQFSYGQVKCYRFSMSANIAWQDTSCVACTSDTSVIASANDQLALPFVGRTKIINGEIAAGSNGVNKNGPHEFLWHFVVNKWGLTDLAPEVCDGRAHSDIDADTAYFFNNVGRYCPWTSIVAEELPTVNILDEQGEYTGIALYPNPAIRQINIVSTMNFDGAINIYSMNGSLIFNESANIDRGSTASFDISQLPVGLYTLQLKNEYFVWSRRLSIVR